MAFLKQILANNGVNIKNIDMNIVPLQMIYNSDYNEINNIIAREARNYDYNANSIYVGEKYDQAAKFFIDSSTQVENISSDVIQTADQINKAIFPFFSVKSDVIGKTVDDWIRNAPTIGESQPLIIREEQPGQWKVFINGKPYEISDPTTKERNKEIRELVSKHLDKLNSNNSYINNIKNYLIDSYRRGYVNVEDLKKNSSFLSLNLINMLRNLETINIRILNYQMTQQIVIYYYLKIRELV